jgi:hypothetical protein
MSPYSIEEKAEAVRVLDEIIRICELNICRVLL